MTRWHVNLAARFADFPKHQQLLMVANELNRAEHLRTNPREYRKALERAMELIDLLSSDDRWRPALGELRRGREMMAQLYISPTPASTTALQRTLIQLNATAWNMLHPLGVKTKS